MLQNRSHGNIFNHDPIRGEKLLLGKKEIEKIDKATKDQGIYHYSYEVVYQ